MNFKKIALIAAGVVITLALWLGWLWQPERQVHRHQRELMASLEGGNYDTFGRLLADDYRDRWGHDKAFVVGQCRDIFRQFLSLEIQQADQAIELKDDGAILREKLHLVGKGVALAELVQEKANALREPFTFVWRKGAKPWEWTLVSVDQPELERIGL